jgi:hypothetical protein
MPKNLTKSPINNKETYPFGKKEGGLLTETRPPRHVTDLVSSTKVYLVKSVSTYHYNYLSNTRANIGVHKTRCFCEENYAAISSKKNHA